MKYLLLIVLLTSTLHAIIRPEPGSFALTGEVLWLHASFEDTYYAIGSSLDTGVTGERSHIDLGFLPAYRLQGAYTFCNEINDFRLQGTYYSHTVKESRTADFEDATHLLLATQIPPSLDFFGGICNIANAINHAQYYEIDGKFSHMIFDDSRLNLLFQVGLHYMHLNTSENYKYDVLTDDTISFTQVIYGDRVWGVGPEVGVDFRYLLPCCFCGEFSFVGNIQGILLAARNRATLRTDNNVQPSPLFHFDFSNDANWRIVPAFDIQLGFNYLKSFRCFMVFLEVGYEFINYFKALDKVRMFENVEGSSLGVSFDKYSDFGLHGPYIALGFTY